MPPYTTGAKQQPKISFILKPTSIVMEKETITSATTTTAPTAVKSFVPYSSPLSFMSPPPEPQKDEADMKVPSYEKKKAKPVKFPKKGKLLNPLSKQGVFKSKSAMKIEIQAKKQKATMARKKAAINRIVPTIELVDSDESDCIPVELPPPPLILLDSSDEEIIKNKRALSPSTSSIISDDFIVAGDKRRLVNPFKSDDVLSFAEKRIRVSHQKATFEKVKALTKVQSSTSSSESAQSSTEKTTTPTEQKSNESRIKRKSANRDRNSLDNSNEDSIYGAKIKTAKPSKKQVNESSEDEAPCVNAKNHKIRRRKSTASRNKSTDQDSDEDVDPKLKLIASTPVASGVKRSRYISSTYNDAEFATMISTILHSGDAEQEESGDDHDDKNNETIQAVNKAISINDSTQPGSLTEIGSKVSQESDCVVIEQSVEIFEVPDDQADSDSDNSMRGFNVPITCDLSLNVTQIPYDPHEYIQNCGENSEELLPLTSTDRVNPEVGWNEEMKFFYDGSWGDENFCISTILNEMPRDPKLWRINNNDRNRTPDSGCRVRCKRCNEVGHYAVKCNRPKKRIVCFMCGDEGHRETRCPKSICLRVRYE